MTTKHYIKTTLHKIIILSILIASYILLSFVMMSCANVNKVQEKEGWFPVGMDEDAQSFYNSKYNTMDNGQDDPNAKVKVFNTKF
jgi:hypothetical protein